MAIIQFAADHGNDATPITTTNGGGPGSDAPAAINGGNGSLVFASAAARHGARGILVVPSSGVIREGRWNFPACDVAHFRGYFRHMATPTAAHTLVQVRPTTGNGPQLTMSTTSGGRLNFQNAAAGPMFGAAGSNIPNTEWRRVEFRITKGTTTGDGQAEYVVYDEDDVTELYHPAPLTNVNTGIAQFTNLRLGRPSGTTADESEEHWDSWILYTDEDVPATMDNPYVPPAASDTEWYMPDGTMVEGVLLG